MTIVPDELRSTLIAVADDQDGVAGVVQIKVVQTNANLLKLFVEPRKLRRGIGSTLFDWAIAQATNMGATKLFIESDPDAAQFYRGVGAFDVGFAPSGSIPGRLLPKLAFNLAGDRV
jgi:N-acetylglutamate synthase-like GNAT family acetyltransferase